MSNPHFPLKGLPQEEIFKYLTNRLAEIPDWRGKKGVYRLGFAMTEPSPVAVSSTRMFLPSNPNNIGIHLTKEEHLTGTRQIEREVLTQLSALLHGENTTGYITSGGTEGNLYGAWVGRSTLRARGHDRILAITSKLVHYSVTKSARILDLPVETIGVNSSYTLEPEDITRVVEARIKEGWTGFVIISTAGYFMTGLVDPIKETSRTIQMLLNSYPEIGFYHHVDAAYGGFVLPFSNPNEQFDFRNKQVHSLSIDAHKMGLLPYSCGVVFCREDLARHVSSYAEQAAVTDSTVIGSRPGASAAALWAVTNSLGVEGYQALVRTAISKRDFLASGLRELDPKVILILRDDMNVLAFSFGARQLIDGTLEQKYRLVSNVLPTFNGTSAIAERPFYHLYTMPSLSQNAIREFLRDIRCSIKA